MLFYVTSHKVAKQIFFKDTFRGVFFAIKTKRSM